MREIRERFHLEKTISIGHIITTGMVVLSAIFYVQRQEQRIGLLEQRLEIEIARSEKMDVDLSQRIEATRKESKDERRALAADMRVSFKEINTKLDQMLREILGKG